MLAYSTTITPEDGPITSNPFAARPILRVGVTLSGLKGMTLLRHSKLATGTIGRASTAILIRNRP